MQPDKHKKFGFTPLADTTSPLIDPLLRKRAGIGIELIEAWSQIVGDDIANNCLPLKINWRRRVSQYDSYEPATLLVACEGFSAMSIQHQSMEIVQKVNVFFGFHAIDRLKIEQKPVSSFKKKQHSPKIIDKACIAQVEKNTADIDSDRLRKCLTELGCHILSKDANSK
ncbi:DciA family protein [Bartonella sp. HY329]|uniref:DUF721 domain-containing protein n=1 Tax=unclassified Bartonella TaxID=2645622 RepID=UPI0021CA2907|nr:MULTISPECIES: DciA family protein [unclassified Bartonella]UXM94159.1 DciA family protein [Bartonella sp. HY329]UXN08481.1 DciA family protein [Bartonella sp. HY328]